MRARVGLVGLLALLGCNVVTGAPVPASPGDVAPVQLTVFAAASLRDALVRAKAAYQEATPGATLTIATDSSAALRTQIEQGAPADVFLSADASNPQALADAGLAAGRPVAFAANALTIVVPAGNPAGIRDALDLGRGGVAVIAAGDEVPVTRYAAEVVERLGITDAYEANVVSREDNVRAVVTKIELGEGDAALVYATDAKASDDVKTVAIPSQANVTATYAGVVVRATDEPAAAGAFLDWLAGPDGRAILSELGFRSPSS